MKNLLILLFAIALFAPMCYNTSIPANEEQTIAENYYNEAQALFDEMETNIDWTSTVLEDWTTALDTQKTRYTVFEAGMSEEDKETYADLIDQFNVLADCLSNNIDEINVSKNASLVYLLDADTEYKNADYEKSWNYSLDSRTYSAEALGMNEAAQDNSYYMNELMIQITVLLDGYEP